VIPSAARTASPRMSVRRPRRSLVVIAQATPANDRRAQSLVRSLDELGVEAVYLGRLDCARSMAAVAAEREADAIELCVERGCVRLLRDLLRALIDLGRRDVSVVVHRIAPSRRMNGRG
jgi:methylmalonyl-CoA mutase cobalamin-binding subunit